MTRRARWSERQSRRAAGRIARRGKPSVLIIVQNLPVPLDRRVWQEATTLADNGYHVSVICPKGSDEPRYRELDGVGIYTYKPAPQTLGTLSFFYEFSYAWLRTAGLSLRAWREHRFEVIQACNPPDTYWALARLFRAAGVRFVYDQHDLSPEMFEERFGHRGMLHSGLLLLEKATYRSADRVVSTNESYREIAQRRGQVPGEEIAVVRSAPDPSAMRRGDPVPELRHGREHLVCYLGIMGPQDGVDWLLRAIDVVVNEWQRSDVHFGILGFGDAEAQLHALGAELGISDFVTFTGRVAGPEIRDWLSTADIGVTPDPPSPYSSLSTLNKTLEYMAHELPVVSFDLTENVRSAGDAALVMPTGVEELARGICALLDDPDTAVQMGRRGRARIEQRLSWAAQEPTYVGVFDDLTSRTKHSARAVEPTGGSR